MKKKKILKDFGLFIFQNYIFKKGSIVDILTTHTDVWFIGSRTFKEDEENPYNNEHIEVDLKGFAMDKFKVFSTVPYSLVGKIKTSIRRRNDIRSMEKALDLYFQFI